MGRETKDKTRKLTPQDVRRITYEFGGFLSERLPIIMDSPSSLFSNGNRQSWDIQCVGFPTR